MHTDTSPIIFVLYLTLWTILISLKMKMPKVLRRENQAVHRRIEDLQNLCGQVWDREVNQTLLQQIENKKKKNKADQEVMSRQMEALKDQIQVLNSKLQDENSLNDKFNVVKEEKEAMTDFFPTAKHS